MGRKVLIMMPPGATLHQYDDVRPSRIQNPPFHMPTLRKFILGVMSEKITESGNKLRPGLSTHPSWITWNGFKFKVLSTSEARVLKPGATRPHRILVWCEQCRKWQYAGKFAQHRTAKDHQIKEVA